MSSQRFSLPALLFCSLILPLAAGGCLGKDTLDEDVDASSYAPTQALPPVIDGRILPGEWQEARLEMFADGSSLFLLSLPDAWYIGIQADEGDMIVVNIYIARSDQIDILHASAALGTASYRLEEDRWLLTREFSWTCRDTSESPAALAERQDFYDVEGWVSTNTYIGNPNESEFMIQRQEESLPLVVTFMVVPGSTPTTWPIGIQDATSRDYGSLPGRLDFSLPSWGILSIADSSD